MANAFDAYYEWLSIPPEEQPANFYRLLGVKLFETNDNVISSAADRQMAHVRSFAQGPRGEIAQQVLNDLSAARLMLLDPARKTAYDAMLRAEAAAETESRAAVEKVAAKETPPPRGAAFGEYDLLRAIAPLETGMLYKARRRSTGQIVSLQIASPQMARSPEYAQRLRREFEITKNVDHPHVVASYEVGDVNGRPFLAFEYVGGADLGRLVAENGPLKPAVAADVVRRVADGLDYLHRIGIVHRNLKPQNILVSVQGNVKIANLTLAREEDSRALLGGREIGLTAEGVVLGSPEYLPPEQAMDSHTVDGRADLYALGCTLHYLLTGKPPYTAKGKVAVLAAHATAAIPSLTAARPDVPPSLDRLFQRLMAKKPADRPKSAAEVIELLAAERPKRKSEISWLVVASVAVAVAVILFLTVLIARSRS